MKKVLLGSTALVGASLLGAVRLPQQKRRAFRLVAGPVSKRVGSTRIFQPVLAVVMVLRWMITISLGLPRVRPTTA